MTIKDKINLWYFKININIFFIKKSYLILLLSYPITHIYIYQINNFK
jgi:hypothetical protein